MTEVVSSWWETEVYAEGRQLNRYPFDSVVAFVFANAPARDARILEVGCGAGNNCWFAAREGFRVSGLDISESAIAFARSRFDADGLDGDLRVGEATALPFDDGAFDLAIDRYAIAYCGFSEAVRAVDEVRRVLAPGGRFLFIAPTDSNRALGDGEDGPDGLTLDITTGPLAGTRQIQFFSPDAVDELFATGWRIRSNELVEHRDRRAGWRLADSQWRVVAERVA
jgi:SAM-dependent methyltransferase